MVIQPINARPTLFLEDYYMTRCKTRLRMLIGFTPNTMIQVNTVFFICRIDFNNYFTWVELKCYVFLYKLQAIAPLFSMVCTQYSRKLANWHVKIGLM